jgi:hypothetical protein
MADSTGPLRIVSRPERQTGRGPGPAVLLVLVYATIFAAALWWIKARSPMFQKRPAPPPPTAQKSDVVPRSALLSGEGLAPVARDEYFRGLSTQCCPCGCEANLRDCLLTEESCAVAPDLAREILEQVRQAGVMSYVSGQDLRTDFRH